MSFSKRMGYKSNKSEEVIIEDAPDGLREFFIDGILDEIIYIDDDDRYASSGKPLGIKRLYKQLCFFLKIPKDVNYWDTAYCWDILMSLIRGVEWYNFYDIIELVGNELREENEEQLDWFLENVPGFTILTIENVWQETIGGRPPGEGRFLRLSPASSGTDGFFCAVFERTD